MKRIAVLVSDDENKIILASGHKHGLQYIDHDRIMQIVSGSGSKHS